MIFANIFHNPKIEEHEYKFSSFFAKIRHFDFRKNRIFIIKFFKIELINDSDENFNMPFFRYKWDFETRSAIERFSGKIIFFEKNNKISDPTFKSQISHQPLAVEILNCGRCDRDNMMEIT